MAPNDHTTKLKAIANKAVKHPDTPGAQKKEPPQGNTKEVTPSRTIGQPQAKDAAKPTETPQSQARHADAVVPPASNPAPSEAHWHEMDHVLRLTKRTPARSSARYVGSGIRRGALG
ncbi:uncharacterized protein BO95DRAFT_426911 [Aspergillus brunneoviolaceus CBS 621.78]|uniref:Uncharacterized protein n=1 Tax=Aspergillus brunneoviolaceus CBS 621.78 TaxID=1450534 RepID=A0ACD1GPV0_9EURO|nr:hypothetical protein BO95DRAFT_426911 [Aspergillus brunneoviolaceus CBS 621.78]RAH51091.1 hypothetical protein BO95DRAFT_426911 [Aspergillus brunneoviolaceus CBS 621.78]